MDKKQSRLRRATRARAKIRELRAYRLCIHRSPRHMYAQVIAPDGGKVVASASTVEKPVRESAQGYSGNTKSAARIGELIAERAKAAGVEQVAFDRSGFKYHGRVKALADAARENGLRF
ncbi:50S ribosomal protein L18 [Thiorhodovibrio frisius]|uniref:Large ribosomal subunit protein uL18 n=1 Tax=Thiorhodovibrio frisius TaxID=631362 RepID=H8Z336_9GAMM|nr:50S ribosomal protein L18 [Thiorhodovibrio frisius]EIC21744.1 ribosomal protein L18, bacterial type [Thiorhodovibrio frisius]WPL21711.1 50S ribosomal protein L18 [Thiorhodovibrio frisius]